MTLTDLATGKEPEMPAAFDNHTAYADRDYSDCSTTTAANARLLGSVMTACGFMPLQSGWWHFTDTDTYPVDKCFESEIPMVWEANCNEYISLGKTAGGTKVLANIPVCATVILRSWDCMIYFTDLNGGYIMKRVNSFVEMCVEKDYVSQERATWLQYALEKRIVTVMGFIPLLILGIMIAHPATVGGFLAAFCLLRSRTNGYHAKSAGRCLIYSIIGEVLFLKVLPMVWNDIICCIVLTVSFVLIWFLAPYNHPNMDLSSEEVTACAKSAKQRLCLLLLALSTLYVQKQNQLALGIFLGIVMAASALAIPYCLQGHFTEHLENQS